MIGIPPAAARAGLAPAYVPRSPYYVSMLTPTSLHAWGRAKALFVGHVRFLDPTVVVELQRCNPTYARGRLVLAVDVSTRPPAAVSHGNRRVSSLWVTRHRGAWRGDCRPAVLPGGRVSSDKLIIAGCLPTVSELAEATLRVG